MLLVPLLSLTACLIEVNLHGPDACAGANVDDLLREYQYFGFP